MTKKNKFKLKVVDEFKTPIFKAWINDNDLEETFKTLKKKLK